MGARTSTSMPGLLLAVLAAAACGAGASAPEAESGALYALPLLGHGRGPADALVTIVEAGDFQCPYCKSQAAVLRQLANDFPADLRLYFAHLPLVEIHERALPAAIGAECAAAQDRFWGYHDALYAAAPAFDEATLVRHATALDLDLAAWRACRDGDDARRAVLAQRARLLAFGVSGTPSFFINGRFVRGGQSLPTLRALVEQALGRAREALAADDRLVAADYYQRAVLEKGRPAGS